jgi:Ca2+-binding RTX toxin-like protein
MRLRTGKALGVLLLLAISVAVAPASAAPVNLLTLYDQKGIDNRITAFTGTDGRLTLTAPEGLGDPDGKGNNCSLDNAQAGQSSAQQVSCAPGYIGAIVGDLGGGNDAFVADADLAVMIGGVIDGQRRPLSGGSGRDRLVSGGAVDLLDGGPGIDFLYSGSGNDVMVGGRGGDSLFADAGNDTLVGGPGPDKLNAGAGRDLCKGGSDADRGKGCEVAQSIP